jgi:type III restriction enzyme
MSTVVLRTETSWIQKTPGVCGGDPCIRNTRITVLGIIEYLQLGITDSELPTRIMGLTADDVAAARAYYAQHRQEIDDIIRAEAEA